jgi:hypothetical protein
MWGNFPVHDIELEMEFPSSHVNLSMISRMLFYINFAVDIIVTVIIPTSFALLYVHHMAFFKDLNLIKAAPLTGCGFL